MSRYDTALKYFNEQKDYMDKKVANGIEEYRKGTAKLIFKGENLPKDITVEVNQKNHEFKFGANIFMLDEFETDEKNKIYREKFPEVFNLATVPFYWSDLELEEGKPRYTKDSPRVYRRPTPDLCIEYCQEKGIEPKCHCLNYENFSPDWLKNAPVSEVKRKLDKRFFEIAERYADVIPSFEVTNETLQPKPEKATAFYDQDDFVEWSFRTADRYFKTNHLIINDFNTGLMGSDNRPGNRTAYYMQIERLLKNGITHIDSIGMQFHSFFPLDKEEEFAIRNYNPDNLYKFMDCYQKLGLKEQITEMTIPAYGPEAENEEIQSILTTNLYKIFFSHPAMEAVIYWNVVDGYAAWAPIGDMTKGENVFYGGMLRHDLSEKPVFKDLKKLINEEWHTKETIKAVNGTAEFKGFYGDYDIKIFADGKEITKSIKLSKEADNNIKISL